MAKVSYIEIPEELKPAFFAGLTPNDRFTHSRIIKNRKLTSRKKRLDLSKRSLFSIIADYWWTLSDSDRNLWREAAEVVGLTNWQLFIQDQAARLAAELPGTGDPNTTWQSWVGKIEIDDYSDEVLILQVHPRVYWVERMVAGSKRRFEPIRIVEPIQLPLQIGAAFRAELEAEDEDWQAEFFAEVWHSYQGADIKTKVGINFPLVTDWTTDQDELSLVAGYIVGYNLFIRLKGVRGKLYFDNLQAIHSAQNWVRDSECKKITKVFPRVFYQIPERWSAVVLTPGAHFASVYRDFEPLD